MQDIRLVRVTTLEAPFLPYIAHYRVHKPGPPPESHQAAFSRETEKRIAASIGDADPLSTRAYQLVLLDSMVHEFKALRGVLGEPMEFAFFAPDSRLIREFPSPYLRNAPTMLVHEGGEIGNGRSWRTEEINSYEESFRQELIHLQQCVTTSKAPTTCAEDALRDVALCQSVIDVHRRRLPRPHPTNPGAG